MNFKNNKWITGILSVFLTLAILSLGQFIWQGYTLAKPLDQALSNITGVEKISWEERDTTKTIVINVTFNNVDNLQQTYKEITAAISKTLGNKKFNISVHDNRTPQLEEFYNSIAHFVHEGIYTGKFSLMVEQIQARAERLGFKVKIFVDNQNVYLQIFKDDNKLYEVIPRISGVR